MRKEYIEVDPHTERKKALLEDSINSTDWCENEDSISSELYKTLTRMREGLIDKDQARKEVSLFMVMIKAREQEQIDKKLDRLLSIIGGED